MGKGTFYKLCILLMHVYKNEKILILCQMIHVDIFSHTCRYLNTTYIKKQKYTDADLSYGGISTDTADQLLEIGEVSRSKKVQKVN